MENFIQKKEDEFVKNLNDLQRKAKQNAYLDVAGIIKQEQLDELKKDQLCNKDLANYMEHLYQMFMEKYESLEAQDER